MSRMLGCYRPQIAKSEKIVIPGRVTEYISWSGLGNGCGWQSVRKNALCKPKHKSIERTGFGGTIKPGKDNCY